MKAKSTNSFDAAAGNTRTWVGVGLVLLSALAFGTNILVANMAYRDGVDVQTVNAARHIVTVTLLFLFLKLRGTK